MIHLGKKKDLELLVNRRIKPLSERLYDLQYESDILKGKYFTMYEYNLLS